MNFKYLSTVVMFACVPFAFGLEEIISGSVQGNEMDSATVENAKNKTEMVKEDQNEQQDERVMNDYVSPTGKDETEIGDSFLSVMMGEFNGSD